MAHAGYLSNVMNSSAFKESVDKMSDIVNKEFPDVDYLMASGISGLSILPAVAYKTGKSMFIVRKEQDLDNHSGNSLEFEDKYIGNREKTAVILDDLISSGDTIRRMVSKIPMEIKVVGIILYDVDVTPGETFNHKMKFRGNNGLKCYDIPLYGINLEFGEEPPQ